MSHSAAGKAFKNQKAPLIKPLEKVNEMSKRIYKYELRINGQKQQISMPPNAKILSVQLQNNNAVMWAQVNENYEKVEIRTFICYGTGQVIPDNPGEYIGTVQYNNGNLVLHWYEIK